MANILVSGLVNMEVSVPVRQFPVAYYPIDYPFFGINSAVSGVAYNIAGALRTLGDSVCLYSLIGSDFQGAYIENQLLRSGIDPGSVQKRLKQTASSVVLYDDQGRRQIYCDLKDVQDVSVEFPEDVCRNMDIVAACNINFNRPLLHLAKDSGVTVATDVHVLSDIHDSYNREFLECADIIFMSDEGIGEDYCPFLYALSRQYDMKILVLGRGSRGAAMYLREKDEIISFPAAYAPQVVNTVGAGDALFSAFLHYYAAGKAPEEALCRAQLFAARKIGVSGASRGFSTAEEMESLWEQFGKSDQKG